MLNQDKWQNCIFMYIVWKNFTGPFMYCVYYIWHLFFLFFFTLLEKILVLLMCITCKISNMKLKLIVWPCYKLALQTVPVHEPLHLSCVCRNILPHSPHNLDDMNVSINLVDGGYITFTIHIQSEFPCCVFVICVYQMSISLSKSIQVL